MKKLIIITLIGIYSFDIKAQCASNPKYEVPEGFEVLREIKIFLKKEENKSNTYSFVMANNETYRLMFIEDEKYKKVASYDLYEESNLIGTNYLKSRERFFPSFDFKCKKESEYQIKVTRLKKQDYCGHFVLLKQIKQHHDSGKVDEYSEKKEPTFVIVDKMPQFIEGGDIQNFIKWVSLNLKYPKEAMETNVTGRVFIQFYVDTEGMVRDVKVVRSVHPLLDKEALRVVSNSPKWFKPGTQRSTKVNVHFTIPVEFKLP